MSLQRLHFVNMYKAFNMAPGPGKHSLSNTIIYALSTLLTSCVMCIDHSPHWGGDVLCVGHQGGDPHSVCVTARLGKLHTDATCCLPAGQWMATVPFPWKSRATADLREHPSRDLFLPCLYLLQLSRGVGVRAPHPTPGLWFLPLVPLPSTVPACDHWC